VLRSHLLELGFELLDSDSMVGPDVPGRYGSIPNCGSIPRQQFLGWAIPRQSQRRALPKLATPDKPNSEVPGDEVPGDEVPGDEVPERAVPRAGSS
jgi:hypothetical protein